MYTMFPLITRCDRSSLAYLSTDIKAANRHHRNDKLNRALQSFMYGVMADDNEAAAKKSLAVCTELWRRHVWRDARTVNVIGGCGQGRSGGHGGEAGRGMRRRMPHTKSRGRHKAAYAPH